MKLQRAILFPGQGAQFKGMGQGLFKKYPLLTTKASEILGYSIEVLCIDDPERQLHLTQYTQPALYVVNALSYLDEEENLKPDYLAGHSLGEYNALLASGVFDFETGIKLVQKRGELMGKISGGTMMAVLGIKASEIEELLKENNIDEIDLANYNTPVQTVLSGSTDAIRTAGIMLEKKGANCISLNVSAAFHSRYMEDAQKEFTKFISTFKFSVPQIPVIANSTARPYEKENLIETLAKQITSSVLWVESIRYLMGQGEMEFKEIGDKEILAKMVAAIQKTEKPLIIEEKVEKKEEKPPDKKAIKKLAKKGGKVQTKTADKTLKQKVTSKPPEPTPVKKEVKAADQSAPKKSSQSITADKLGNENFKKEYNLKYAYLGGGMYRGIASAEMVINLGRAGLMGYFGAAGLSLAEIKEGILMIQEDLSNSESYGMNLICNLDNPAIELETVKLYLDYNITKIEAAAFMQITPALVLYRLKGLEENEKGEIECKHKILGKISRPEVAENFMSPAPERIVEKLLDSGQITSKQAELAKKVPMSNEICVEADSGGHTDQGIPTVLLPAIASLRKELIKKYDYKRPIYLGQAGGIGAPESALAAFIMGADFILTGSINQCTQEGGISDSVKTMLQDINVQDTAYAPSGDMFEVGARVQVLRKGVFFPARANKLHTLYSQYSSLEEIPEKIQKQVQEKYFKKSFDEIWEETKSFIQEEGQSSEIEKAQGNAKHKMALIFRWYFNYSSQLSFKGQEEDRVNYQVYTGPALGAFNQWIKGTELEDWRNRQVADIGIKLMKETAELLNEKFKEFINI